MKSEDIPGGYGLIKLFKERNVREMKLILPGNLVIEGTFDQLRDVARQLGVKLPTENDGVHYFSQSKQEFIRIKDMDTKHIINALLKLYHAEVDALPKDRPGLVTALRIGVVARNKTLHALVNELLTRRD